MINLKQAKCEGVVFMKKTIIILLAFVFIIVNMSIFAAENKTKKPDSYDISPILLWGYNSRDGMTVKKSFEIFKTISNGKSNFSYQISCTKPNYVQLVRTLTVKPNHKYELSGWIKTENLKNGDIVYVTIP